MLLNINSVPADAGRITTTTDVRMYLCCRFRAMLQEANSKVSMLYSEGHTGKSSTFHHDKQLEELRNLQVIITAQKKSKSIS